MHEQISRSEALEKGHTHYFTGYFCKHGHQAPRLVSTRRCTACAKQQYSVWAESNRNVTRSIAKRWREQNPSKRAAYEAKRRAQKLRATLPGYDAEIMQIYIDCPPGMEVDHIEPLNGKTTCGLHVPWNLQYLTPLANQRKGNRLYP